MGRPAPATLRGSCSLPELPAAAAPAAQSGGAKASRQGPGPGGGRTAEAAVPGPRPLRERVQGEAAEVFRRFGWVELQKPSPEAVLRCMRRPVDSCGVNTEAWQDTVSRMKAASGRGAVDPRPVPSWNFRYGSLGGVKGTFGLPPPPAPRPPPPPPTESGAPLDEPKAAPHERRAQREAEAEARKARREERAARRAAEGAGLEAGQKASREAAREAALAVAREAGYPARGCQRSGPPGPAPPVEVT